MMWVRLTRFDQYWKIEVRPWAPGPMHSKRSLDCLDAWHAFATEMEQIELEKFYAGDRSLINSDDWPMPNGQT